MPKPKPNSSTSSVFVALGLILFGIFGLVVGPIVFPDSMPREQWLYAIGLQIFSIAFVGGGLGALLGHAEIGLSIGFVLGLAKWIYAITSGNMG